MDKSFLLNKSKKINSRASSPTWWKDKPVPYNIFLDDTKFLSPDTSFAERAYCWVNNISLVPTCTECNTKNCKFSRVHQKYLNVCSQKCANKSPEKYKKMSATKLEKYGANNLVNQNKSRQTRLEKYGRWDSPKALAKRKEIKYSDLYNKTLLEDLHHTKKLTAQGIAKQLNTSPSFVDKLLDKLNIEKKKFKFSDKELEVYEFIKTIYTQTIFQRHKIGGFEVDIFLPDINLAIEFNGNYWHSINDKNTHIIKTDACEQLGIHLIHIFEHDWAFKRDKVCDILRYKIGGQPRVFARKCEVKLITSREGCSFLQTYHIQNSAPASIYYGLYHQEELVACASFRKARFEHDNGDTFELIRFAAKYRVLGGLGKLLKAFETEYCPKTIISYADRTFFTGASYSKVGFSFIKNTTPDYVWLHPNESLKIYRRYQTQKHKLKTLINNYDANLTEDENMCLNGFQKLWMVGHKKYVKTLTQD